MTLCTAISIISGKERVIGEAIMRLFIIPWLMFGVTVKAQDAVVTPNHGQLLDTSLYQFIQRQNQINSAIMLNNALLANSLATVPANEHQIRLPNTLQFPFTYLPPLFHEFPQTLTTGPITGLDRLGIYDALSNVRSVDDMKYPLLHSQETAQQTTMTPTVQDTILPSIRHIIDSEKIHASFSGLDDDLTEVTDISLLTSPLSMQVTNIPFTQFAESKTKIEGETSINSHKEIKDERDESKENVYNLLKTLNLTDEESKDIVSRVEKIVREELVKKLSEVQLSDHTNPPDVSEESSTLVSTTDATTQVTSTEEMKKTDNHATTPLSHSTPEKQLLLIVPKKKKHSEIKHHPRRISNKNTEMRRQRDECVPISILCVEKSNCGEHYKSKEQLGTKGRVIYKQKQRRGSEGDNEPSYSSQLRHRVILLT
ncbi:hypothetical protein KIN20_001188 [Parelaphostrongylus tenuis]|uniref:Uncharacterized protein n=1 Tax=Parelaphostrongylus tenuis TaxID=148309 RepID=A0AAD5LTR1_PARTN|nr:hypothetical protein KIN20_001188 [Parelaphostrongylus tenuis]